MILYGLTGRVGMSSLWWRWGRIQWLVLIGLTPILLLLFQRSPLLGALANLIAVPWVGLLAAPTTLLGALTIIPAPLVGGWLLQLAELVMEPLWMLLDWAARLPYAQWTQHKPVAWTLSPAAIGVLLLLAPRGFPARWLGVIFFLPLFLVRPASPAPGEAWLTLLDVGQGLASIVRTSNHVLVYDTGPRFSQSFDAGSAVVLPYLRQAGIGRIDMLVVSHSDNDHMGGASAVIKQVPVVRILSGTPQNISWATADPCRDDQSWRWDGVELRMLHPHGNAERSANNSSCVLQVSTAAGTLLLTGDIEAAAEQSLLDRHRADLSADVIVAPHHGSASSSTDAFVEAVSPGYALFPVGYRNRWGLPKQQVAQRYLDAGASVYDTATHGAVTVKLGAEGVSAAPEAYREQRRRYWNFPASD